MYIYSVYIYTQYVYIQLYIKHYNPYYFDGVFLLSFSKVPGRVDGKPSSSRTNLRILARKPMVLRFFSSITQRFLLDDV